MDADYLARKYDDWARHVSRWRRHEFRVALGVLAFGILATAAGGAPYTWATRAGIGALGCRVRSRVVGSHPVVKPGAQGDPAVIEGEAPAGCVHDAPDDRLVERSRYQSVISSLARPCDCRYRRGRDDADLDDDAGGWSVHRTGLRSGRFAGETGRHPIGDENGRVCGYDAAGRPDTVDVECQPGGDAATWQLALKYECSETARSWRRRADDPIRSLALPRNHISRSQVVDEVADRQDTLEAARVGLLTPLD